MIDWLQQFFHRITSVFRREKLDRDLDAELAAHLELAIEENLQRGLSADEARRQALIRFGGKQQAIEQHRDARGLPGLEILFQDLRYAVRALFKNPGFTIAVVVTLALGIAVNATMFSLVSAFLLRRPVVHEPDRVAVVTSINPARGFLPDTNPVSAPNYFAWREANDVFSDISAADEYRSVSLTAQGKPEALPSAAVSSNYFNVLGVAAHLGRTFSEGEDQPGRDHVVILSHELWAATLRFEPFRHRQHHPVKPRKLCGDRCDARQFSFIGLHTATLDPTHVDASGSSHSSAKRSYVVCVREIEAWS